MKPQHRLDGRRPECCLVSPNDAHRIRLYSLQPQGYGISHATWVRLFHDFISTANQAIQLWFDKRGTIWR